jgi:hypothetical protein
LLFCFPVGGGIPVGVLLAQAGGVPPLGTAALYFLSDIVLALTTEPMLAFLRWLSRRIPALARVGEVLARFSAKMGLRDEGARGPLGLILVSFAVSPTTGRAAASAAGHGFLPGWALAITGDMGYFGLLMVSTLWLSTVLGNDRLTVGLMLVVTWLLPVGLKWLRRQGGGLPTGAPVAASVLTPAQPAIVRARSRKRSKGGRKAPGAPRRA